ncbi:MAG TPA: hypothetical protein VM686_08555 [Polyangiaceae bacterium]|nr:hypothetical protein [Polyangiaceae bacterium]
MKRPVSLVALLLSVGLVVPGCPIYNEGGCTEDAHCAPGYVCELLTGECVEPSPPCERPSDCTSGETCDREGRCRSVDCSWADVGCVSGYECVRDGGVWRCVSPSSGSGGEGPTGTGGVPSYGGSGNAEGGVLQSSGGEPASGGQQSAGGAVSSGGAAGETSVGGASSDAGGPGVPAGGAPAGGAPSTAGQGGV